MVYKVIVDPKVHNDLHDIHRHIAEDNPVAANDFIDIVERSMNSLAVMPERNQLRPDLRKGYRVVIMGNYLLFYRIVGDEVQVARVIRSSRDTPRAFEE